VSRTVLLHLYCAETVMVDCAAMMFHCDNKYECVSMTSLCNLYFDCSDGSDERRCRTSSFTLVVHSTGRQSPLVVLQREA